MLKEIKDKSSWEAEKILQGKIDFYINNKQPDKADEIIRENLFDAKYYKIYKSTFAQEEWMEKVEELIQYYDKRNNRWFNESIADILQAEKQEERLMKYVEKHLSVDNLEKYHTVFSSSFPEETLALFRKTIDHYAQSTGREIYERIANLFKKMAKIKGGSEVVREMITQYRVLYKNRRTMMEIINKFTNGKS